MEPICAWEVKVPSRFVKGIQGVGHRVIDSLWRLGVASRFFVLILLHSGTSFRRLHLVIKELFSTGVLSLIIILVSGSVRWNGIGDAGL